MKSKLVLKISAIDYYTMSQISFKESIICDGLNFFDKQTEPIDINGRKIILPSYIITAKQQADEWVSNQTDFLNNLIHNPKRELNCILNWEVIKIENEDEKGVKSFPIDIHKKEKKQNKLSELELIKLFLIELGESRGIAFDEDFTSNFLHVFHEMKSSLKGLDTFKKINIVLSSMGVGFKAASTAYKNIYDRLSGSNIKKLEEELKNDEKKELN